MAKKKNTMITAARQLMALEKAEAYFKSVMESVDTVNNIEKTETEWLVPKWIPKGAVTLLAGEGGVGKTTIWCRLVAEITQGRTCFLEDPENARTSENTRCMFFSSEDNVGKRLKEQFENYLAYEDKLITINPTVENLDLLKRIKVNSNEFKILIMRYKPAICVLDPIQSYLPEGMNMNSRNGIRDCMDGLNRLGSETGTAFLLVCHTNKRDHAAGRNRLANSADLWDAARSVIMAGKAHMEGRPEIRYISNEKNNYAPLEKTLLYQINSEGVLQIVGESARHDAEFVEAAQKAKRAAEKASIQGECRKSILRLLREAEGKQMLTAELDACLAEEKYASITVKRVKAELKAEGKTEYGHTGFGNGTKYYTKLIEDEKEK